MPERSHNVDSAAGWVVVAATTITLFAVFGVVYSFGAMFTAIRDEFGVGKGQAALFFSITTFIYFILGVFTGRLADRYGPRPVLLVGAVAMGAGLFLTSLVNNIIVGYLTYGIGAGIGVGCAYVPMVAAVGGWFERDRTKAMGVAVSGIGVGTLVGAPLAKQLVISYGWRSTFVVLGVGSAALLVVASIGARRPPGAGTQETPPPLRLLLHDRRFTWLYTSMTFLSAGLFVPMIYLDDYLDAQGKTGGALLIGITGAASVVGRLALGAVGAKVDLMRLYQCCVAALGASYFIWIVAGANYTVLVIFVLVMGTAYGGWIALSPAVIAHLFGPVGLGGVLGALYTSAGIGGLFGPPLIGVVIDATSYETAIGLAIALSAISLVLLRTATRAAESTAVDAVQPTEEVPATASVASAWLVPSTQGGMRLIRR
ncbi:MAG: MFS transporter [Actinomycetota bacterium]|nr:MFS transporter [Actinomycetota bacterium]MEC9058484.1 MFS transporter [Actinomycetota bacterium]MED5361837.1 MFS transporter [Actinomycetota bacterium]